MNNKFPHPDEKSGLGMTGLKENHKNPNYIMSNVNSLKPKISICEPS